MKVRSVIAERPDSVSVRTDELPPPGDDEVVVESQLSAISQGTEKKFLKGLHTHGSGLFAKSDPIGQKDDFPFHLGYSVVGRISEVGSDRNEHLIGRSVFAYHPHCSSFLADPNELVLLPEDGDPQRYVFFANMETAAGLIMDGRPMIGEEVMIMGQGVIGLLLTKILSMSGYYKLVTVDKNQYRRKKSVELGADISLAPEELDPDVSGWEGFDLIFELTGNVEALNMASKYCGYSGRLTIGSYYGDVPGELKLGDGFHRKRLRIRTSQVSTIDPEYTGRWNRERRLHLVKILAGRLDTSPLITHRFDIDDAEEAYSLLLSGEKDHLQILLEY